MARGDEQHPAPKPANTPIGFIGLGHMGAAMAQRLLAAGFSLAVHDRHAPAAAPLAAAGATVLGSAVELANRCAVVFLCLPSPAASLEVGLALSGGSALRTVVETSTVGPQAIARLVEVLSSAGITVLDAPVSGGPRAAAAGSLAMMVAGSATARESARGALEAIAGRLFTVGDAPGLAQVCKLVNNAISAAGMIAACEATLVGVKAGLDARTLIDAINAGSGRCAATLDKFPRSILPGTFDYGGPLGLMIKDLDLFSETAASLGLADTIAPATRAAWQQAVLRTGADADYSAVIRHMEADAGVVVRDLSATRQEVAS